MERGNTNITFDSYNSGLGKKTHSQFIILFGDVNDIISGGLNDTLWGVNDIISGKADEEKKSMMVFEEFLLL